MVRIALGVAMAGLAVACGSPAAPTVDDLTGYVMIVTPSVSCSGMYAEPIPVVLKRWELPSKEGGMLLYPRNGLGGSHDVGLSVTLLQESADRVQGQVHGGTFTVEVPPRVVAFGGASIISSGQPLPFSTVGVLGGEFSATLSGALRAPSTCTASDHRLHFRPVFQELD